MTEWQGERKGKKGGVMSVMSGVNEKRREVGLIERRDKVGDGERGGV